MRCSTAGLRLLLERMKNVHAIAESYCVHCSERIATEVSYNFNNAGAAETAERFRVAMPAPLLCDVQSVTHVILHLIWEASQVIQAGSHPNQPLQYRTSTKLDIVI